MQPGNIADKLINLADHVFPGILAVLAIAVLLAVGRWLWLLAVGIFRSGQSRKHVVELVALSIPFAALAVAIAWAVFMFSEAGSLSS